MGGAGPGQYDTAAKRWAGVGPYYAMFPTDFADRVVRHYTKEGDTVLDPFAGRGTSIFSAAVQGRSGIGIEVSPVGWVYTRTKLAPAGKQAVSNRIRELDTQAGRFLREAEAMPEFFHHCYSPRVQQFLLAARKHLDWRGDRVDRTLMALLLVYLHGKRGGALSNQMRQAKSMAPDYAVRWWKDRQLAPPDVDPVDFLTRRLEWRYAKGRPSTAKCWVYLRDSVERLPELKRELREGKFKPVRLLLTSPPYYGVTNYHYDQWLRLWLLGGAPNARRPAGAGDHRDKFENLEKYRRLLVRVFEGASALLDKKSSVYVRTDRRELTRDVTNEILRTTFPGRRIRVKEQPFQRPTQTSLFGDASVKAGEVDFIISGS
ncbi:DNA methyltransferase [Myxococcus sp. AM010]|uniref:DNA methyltransferase n=1 Tax=Myxococcus sp. AM010 TaxID=2745138 RepID=UPI0015963028|nr:DNA methyltransferase [Myxococcus sp. AM010]NVJ15703.1 site-specific DNA-methyltransferase [Myxococcus sp. AM010]